MASPDLQAQAVPLEGTFWGEFDARPDRPEMFDEQSAFINAKDTMSFLVGGNAAGTTEAAAAKCARFLLAEQPPPRPGAPFWVISNTYDQVCGVCWGEKLNGNGHIPNCEVEWDKIHWYKTGRWPFVVPLKPWPKERGGDGKSYWQLEFKSYEQGWRALQARSIGGFWFSEQFPLELLLETLRGCRMYMFPGGQFAEFTPLDPDLCVWLEKVMDDPPRGWGFYRANTECNRPNLAADWYDSFFGVVPDEMRETRMTGALATFEGVIYQAFNPAIHVIRGRHEIPRGVWHYRGIDWGASIDHPFACVWGYRDGIGDWVIYDEYWSTDQSTITQDHARAILERSAKWGWPGKWKSNGGAGPQWEASRNPNYCTTYADPSRPGEINEFAFRGIPCMGAANDVYKGIDTVRSLLRVRPSTQVASLRIHERCTHLIEEMRKYRWRRSKSGLQGALLNPKVALPVPLKRDDDTCDALRYMIHTTEISEGLKPSSMSHRQFAERKSIQRSEGQERQVHRAAALTSGWFQG